MSRKCLRCQKEMIENCQANVSGGGQYVTSITKKIGVLKRNRSSCLAAVCSECGYVEFYVEEPHKFADDI